MTQQLPEEIQAVFDKYCTGKIKKLKRSDAIHMLEWEFNQNEEQAAFMFETFDKNNDKILSLEEFRNFYMTILDNHTDVMEKFKELDKDGSGKLDTMQAKRTLRSIKSKKGNGLTEDEINFFLKTSADERNKVDIPTFYRMLCRLRICTPKVPE